MIVIFFILSCKFFSYFNTCPYNILPDPFINVIINKFFQNSMEKYVQYLGYFFSLVKNHQKIIFFVVKKNPVQKIITYIGSTYFVLSALSFSEYFLTCFDNACIRELIFDLATTSRFMIKSTLMNLYHHFPKLNYQIENNYTYNIG